MSSLADGDTLTAPLETEITLTVNEQADHHATGIRVRDLPIRIDRLIDAATAIR